MPKPLRLVVLLLLIQLPFSGCLELPHEPVAPTWDVQVSAALSKTSHSIRDLVSDLAMLPPEVLDTLDLTLITIQYRENVAIGDTSGDGLDDSGLNSEFFRSISHARVFVEAANGTPTAMEVSLEILDSIGQVLLELPGTDSLMYLTPAPLDVTGKVVAPTITTADLEVEDGLSALFENAQWLSYTIDIHFPANVTVDHILSSDSLAIRTWGTFVSRVEP
jgi:hypothetical protein